MEAGDRKPEKIKEITYCGINLTTGYTSQPKKYFDVIPANAGIQVVGERWIPA